MRNDGFKDHFSTGSPNYSAYRPTYPIELIDALAELSPGRERALDCGCGTGQLSVLLASRFQNVIATDASAEQIANAQPRARVSYRVALAECSGLPNQSVDLVTVAQAAHWLDLGKLYTEVRRVARARAVLALITYGVLHVDGAPGPIIQRFYYDTIGQYWPPERRHVEDGYQNLPFPFQEMPFPELAIEVAWGRERLIGYMNTWSAVKAAEQTVGCGIMDALRDELRPAWSDPEMVHRIRFPLSLRVGRVA